MTTNARSLLVSVLVALSAAPMGRAEVRAGPEVEASVEKALEFLSRLQRDDGAIADGPNSVAMTGLSLLAFLSSGHTPDAGRHELVVRGAIDYLLTKIPKDGYVGGVDGSRMYGQGIVALALAESLGVESDVDRREKIRSTLARMIEVILKAQKVQKEEAARGGWRYEPGSADSDLSLSGWCALALRAAQNVGMNVSKQPIDQAINYVARCYRGGAFAYQPGNEPNIAMTSVAVLNLYLLDAADRDEVKRAAEWLAKQSVTGDTRYFYYSLYYSTQATTQAGGALQEQYWKNNRKLLLSRQQDDGGFPQSPTSEEPGRVYATAMSVLTLAVPFQTLPIYQK
jgi:hypothetical protein